MSFIAEHAVDWLLSWMLHATVACVFALVVGRWMLANPRWRDALWKAALLLPVVTSLVSVAAHPITSRSLDLTTFVRPHLPPPLRQQHVWVEAGRGGTSTTVSVTDSATSWLRNIVLASFLIPGIVATSRLVQMRRRFWKDLGARRAADLKELCIDSRSLSVGQRKIRITVSPLMASAAAVARDEICVSQAFTTLSATEQDGVLAHEIAHIERHDLAWTAFADTIACVLTIQPLVSMVARRFRRDAEFICDDAAVNRTGCATAYVRALAVFASEHDGRVRAELAYGSSPIVERAERVLAQRAENRPLPPRIAAALSGLMLIGLLSLPRVSTNQTGPSVHTQVSAHRLTGSRAALQIKATIASSLRDRP